MKVLAWQCAPLIAVVIAFVAVLEAPPHAAPWRTSIPNERFQRDRCTWYCHNHGCRHRAALPAFLTGDHGLFGATIRALRTVISTASPGHAAEGYGAANLVVFCVAWPGVMYGLYLVAIAQRRRLQAQARTERVR